MFDDDSLTFSEGVAEREEVGRGGEKNRLEALAEATEGERLESVRAAVFCCVGDGDETASRDLGWTIELKEGPRLSERPGLRLRESDLGAESLSAEEFEDDR